MTMSFKNKTERTKPFLALEGTSTHILVLMLLAGSGFVLISSATTPMTTAFAQEEDDDNNNNIATSTPINTTISATTISSSEIELSPQPIYQEHVRDVSETLINQTHAQLIVEGNGTLTLPNSSETIGTTSTGSGIVSIIGTFVGKEILTTEDGSENATAISYEIARSNKEEGIGKGIAIAIIHTNSTGRLAPLNGMILVGQEEIQPDGRPMLTFWEWQSGIPLSTAIPTAATAEDSPPLMETPTAADATVDDTTATTAPPQQGEGGEEG
jgi:hypothetical protein